MFTLIRCYLGFFFQIFQASGDAACSAEAMQVIDWVAYLLQCDSTALAQGTRMGFRLFLLNKLAC